MDKLQAYIDLHKERFVEELCVLLRQPSVSARGEGCLEFADLLAETLESLGVSAEVMSTPGLPMVCGHLPGPAGAPSVLVYGHYDVQPPEPLEEWLSPPFEPTVRDGRIFARGSSDNKGQFFTYLKAIEALKSVKGGVPVTVKFLFEGEEEIGSPNLKAFAENNRERLAADLTLFSDSHIHESGRPLIILGLKGLLYVDLRAKGVCSNQHSGRAASLPNPAWELVWALASLKDRNNRVLIPGFYDQVRESNDLEKAAIEAIPCDEKTLLEYYGIDAFAPGRFSQDYYFNLVTEPTCNISGIGSGYTGPGNQNLLPAKALAKLDFRLVPDQDPDDIFDKLQNHLSEKGFSRIEAVKLLSTESSRTSIDHPAMELIGLVLKEVYGTEPIVFPGIGASGPNFVFTNILKQPCFLIPFASVDQCNHGPNENLTIDGLLKGIQTTAKLLDRLGSA
jgi:acetylornithine deacetylase/succinyl-diaminopimelate desuccinylase-like protein